MAFTEFYANASTGSNLNAGSTEGSPVFSFTGGNWTNSTRVYTATGQDLSAVSVNMFGAVHADGSTVTGFIGRVIAVDDGADTITFSSTASSGTNPTDGTGNRSVNIGGVHKGPNAAEAFPIGFISGSLLNTTGHYPRINLKNNATYNVTANLAYNQVNTNIAGYSSTPGDGGKATIDGGGTGASYTLLTLSAAHVWMDSLILNRNGSTGVAAGCLVNVSQVVVSRCVFSNMVGAGVNITSTATFVECESFSNNSSNTSNSGGVTISSSPLLLRFISHDNTGSNSRGFYLTAQGAVFCGCIADSNGHDGLSAVGLNSPIRLFNCDFYNNGGDGADIDNSTQTSFSWIENCNFVKNGTGGAGYGLNIDPANGQPARMVVWNCGFGSGSMANTSGTINDTTHVENNNPVTYAADIAPWVDPATGDFRINLAAAINTGRGSFTQTQGGYGGTIGYPDIGAAPHLATATPRNLGLQTGGRM